MLIKRAIELKCLWPIWVDWLNTDKLPPGSHKKTQFPVIAYPYPFVQQERYSYLYETRVDKLDICILIHGSNLSGH